MAAKKTAKRQRKTAPQNPQSKARKNATSDILRVYRKEISGVLCLLVAILIITSNFDKNSAIAKFFMGLVGEVGLYVLPIGLVLSFVALVFHGGRTVIMRIICSVSFAFLVSAISHLIRQADLTTETGLVVWNGAVIRDLYLGGILGRTGGIFGGLIAMTFSLLGGVAMAWVISILLLIVTLPASLNLTLTGLLRALNNRRERLAKEVPEELDEQPEPMERIVESFDQHRQERQERSVRPARKERQARFDYDLPVDDPPAQSAPEKKKGRRAGVKSPDEFIEEKRAERRSDMNEPMQPRQYTFQSPQAEAIVEQPKKQAEVAPVTPAADTVEKVKPEETRKSAAEVAQQIAEKKEEPAEEYTYPPADLLIANKRSPIDGTQEMRDNTRRLKETLECFNVDAEIINVTRGPAVTMYELELAQGVRLNRLTGLSVDIALALGAANVRISAIPDKISVVGIEVPNKAVSTISAREVVDSDTFKNAESKLTFAVGKDISGSCIVGDISKLPHMLIAGTTGSGKSVCMNSLIISLLYKSKPEEVRFIMIDPKMVELGVYNGIPHLLIPVVTDPKKASGALQWTVTEMMRRYRMMSEAEVRDLESYNELAAGIEDMKPLERVVVVIDELSDLMMAAAKEVEESICRIAQMGRAAGIHLIIATQRPSADVITGLMKANIPSRIAFAVSSAMESRIILDTMGAEKLVGKGDMLFAPLGKGKPKRVQGCFISDHEVQNVVEFIKTHSNADYSDDIQAQIDLKAEQSGKSNGSGASQTVTQSDDSDELLPAAVEVILETGQASVSMLQRRLKLGYARAARIVDEMEERGIVGPFEGSKPRQLLVTKEQWQQMRAGGVTAQMSMEENPPVEDELL